MSEKLKTRLMVFAFCCWLPGILYIGYKSCIALYEFLSRMYATYGFFPTTSGVLAVVGFIVAFSAVFDTEYDVVWG